MIYRTRKAAFAAAIEAVEKDGDQRFVQQAEDGGYEVHGYLAYPGAPFYGAIRTKNADAYRHWFSDRRLNVGDMTYDEWNARGYAEVVAVRTILRNGGTGYDGETFPADIDLRIVELVGAAWTGWFDVEATVCDPRVPGEQPGVPIGEGFDGAYTYHCGPGPLWFVICFIALALQEGFTPDSKEI